MVHRVVSDSVAAVEHLAQQFGIALDILPDHEESGLDIAAAVAVECVEHPRRHLRYRPVVESNENLLPTLPLYTPERFREK